MEKITESKRLVKAYIGSRRKILFLGASLNYSKICRSGMRYQYPALIDARVLISIRKKVVPRKISSFVCTDKGLFLLIFIGKIHRNL